MILRRVTEHARTQNWFAVVLDLVVVIVGVFLGLLVTQWNEDRRDLSAEREYLERLADDLAADIDGYDNEIEDLDLKEASLKRLQAAFRAGPAALEDPEPFLSDVVEGANRGWSQWEGKRSTFNELISSGQLNLLQSPALRSAINVYFDDGARVAERIGARESRFPELSYRLVPRVNEADRTFGTPTVVDLDGVEPSELAASVFASELREYVIAEINFSRFVRDMDEERQRQAMQLLDLLDSYREAIE